MTSILASLSFAKLVMIASSSANSAGDARNASEDPFVHSLIDCSIQYRLQTQLGVRSFYVKRKTNYNMLEHILSKFAK